MGLDALRLACDLDQGLEALGVLDGHLGKDLAVELHPATLQTGDEPAVGHAVRAGGCVDPRDPEAPELPLAVAAVPVGVGEGVEELLLGGAEVAAAHPAVAGRGC